MCVIIQNKLKKIEMNETKQAYNQEFCAQSVVLKSRRNKINKT